MANEIHAKIADAETLTIRPDLDADDNATGLEDEEGRVSAVVAGATAPQMRVYYKVTTANTPTDNSLIEFYIARGSKATTDLVDGGGDGIADASDGLSTTAAPLVKNQAQFVHAQVTSGTSGDTYTGSFMVDSPTDDWRLIIVNETGATMSSTQGDHVVQYRYITPEVQ